ncbi:DUF5990 family protein [Streptomyces sp. NPDC005722]
MRIHVEAHDLPGRTFGGHCGVHVAVQRRARPAELLDPLPGDAAEARWDLGCRVRETPDGPDVTGPWIQGGPGARFVYLSWGTVAGPGDFTMFRRAKLMLDGVEPGILRAAVRSGTLVGRLGLTDARGGRSARPCVHPSSPGRRGRPTPGAGGTDRGHPDRRTGPPPRRWARPRSARPLTPSHRRRAVVPLGHSGSGSLSPLP